MRTKRKRRLTNFIILFVVILVILSGLFLFRVRKVTVSGNSRYSAEEIEEGLITDFLSGSTLYLWWTYRNGEIPDTMPYLDTLKVTMTSPFAVRVTVTEKDLVGYFDTGSYAYFDEDGVILEITDELYDGIPIITGATLGEMTLYQKAPTESSSQLRTILSLLELLDYQELTASEIRFAEDSEITVYIGYIEAVLGQDEYLEEKIANLKAILNTMSASSAGTLHLENVTGKNEDITFTPSDEVIVETENETEENGDSDAEASGTTQTAADTSTLSGATTDGGAASGTTDSTGDSASDSGDTASEDGTDSADSGSADASDTGTADAAGTDDDSTGDDSTADDDTADDGESDVDLMVFNSSGQLVYHVHVKDGVVIDSSGNEVPGCYVNEDGNVVDAYMNIIDPDTGDVLNID
ncbi:MAG: cell division protein FtsQ/DivIB [Clostridiales bacterium]|nr:cell division protein FtsQ/DivIB [Clostridiales bacterium]